MKVFREEVKVEPFRVRAHWVDVPEGSPIHQIMLGGVVRVEITNKDSSSVTYFKDIP